MPGRQAKTLAPFTLTRMLARAARTPTPERDTVIILLSAKAGLRACEIARLDWSMVLNDKGRIGTHLTIEDRIAKKRSGRRIPINDALRCALSRLLKISDRNGPVVRSARGGRLRPNSIVNWYVALFKAIGVKGCSSHSGRRTFITNAARSINRVGGSLRDVQLLAGHRSIETTQAYIDGCESSQRKIVNLI